MLALPPRRILAAGAAYFAIVFAAGFILGAVRTLYVAPRVGALAAVALELPLMLGIAWLVAPPLMRRLAIQGQRDALAMGAVAFVVLIVAEFLLAASLGTPPAAYAASLATPAGALGLAGQILFALIPALLVNRIRRQ